MKLVIWTIVILAVLVGGCTTFSAKDRLVVDHRQAVMNAAADKINASTFEQLKDDQVLLFVAYIVECERRAAVNLSDAAHWRKPTYEHNPKMPTALPWTPVDEEPQ